MREIKFKYYFRSKEHPELIQSSIYTLEQLIKEDPDDNPYWELIDRVQYTGLHDKNGKEIYEGDICLFKDFHQGWNPRLEKHKWDMIGVVVWYDDTNPDPSWKFKVVGGNYFDNWCYKKEVIGNIYQNLELLEC